MFKARRAHQNAFGRRVYWHSNVENLNSKKQACEGETRQEHCEEKGKKRDQSSWNTMGQVPGYSARQL